MSPNKPKSQSDSREPGTSQQMMSTGGSCLALPERNSGQRGSSKRPCWHPSGMPRWVGGLPVVSLTLDHRLQAGMPPAAHSDELIWSFCFRTIRLCTRIRSTSHKRSLSPIRTRTTPLSRSNAHSTAFQFRPVSDTSGNRISEVMPLLYSHDPPKTAKNLVGRIKTLDTRKLPIAGSSYKDGKTNVSEICKTWGISRAKFYRNMSANAV
jgi:hypothetical protein